MDIIPSTFSKRWTCLARSSMVPFSSHHIGLLKSSFSDYKQVHEGKVGIPLSMVPKVLESAKFISPSTQDLVLLIQKNNPEYRLGDLVRWSSLQQLALQLERRETKYPSVFNSRLGRRISTSPTNSKSMQRSPSRRTHPEDDLLERDPQVHDMITKLDHERRKYVNDGDYLGADAIAQRLYDIKIFEDNKRRHVMLEKHSQEREQGEKALQEEVHEINQLWEDRLRSFQKEFDGRVQHLKDQHMKTMNEFKEKKASKIPCKPQWSIELLKQRKIQNYLAKQGKYIEAEKIKQQADRMELMELQTALASFQVDAMTKEQALQAKHKSDTEMLLQRAARMKEKMHNSRYLELKRCKQKHKNVMSELTAIQKQGVFRFEQLMKKKVQYYQSGLKCRHMQSLSPVTRSLLPE